MNESKIPIVHPKKQARPSKMRQVVVDDPFYDPKLNQLLKDNPDIPQISREQGRKQTPGKTSDRTKIPTPRRKIQETSNLPNRKENENKIIINERCLSENEVTPAGHIRKEKNINKKPTTADNDNHDDLHESVFIQPFPVQGSSKIIQKAESTKELVNKNNTLLSGMDFSPDNTINDNTNFARSSNVNDNAANCILNSSSDDAVSHDPFSFTADSNSLSNTINSNDNNNNNNNNNYNNRNNNNNKNNNNNDDDDDDDDDSNDNENISREVYIPKEPKNPKRSPRKNRPKSVREEIERKYSINNNNGNEINSENNIYGGNFSEIIKRKTVLTGIARYFYPDSSSDQEAILDLIELNKDFDELNDLKQEYKRLEEKNKELLLAPLKKMHFNGSQTREAKNIVNEIGLSRRKIAKLKSISVVPSSATTSSSSSTAASGTSSSSSTTMRSYNPQEDIGFEKIDQQVTFTKMKNQTRALAAHVTSLENELADVERRIKLMTQGKSNYSGIHADRIRDEYGKISGDIIKLGEDTEEDMEDTGIFTCRVSQISEQTEEDMMEDIPDEK